MLGKATYHHWAKAFSPKSTYEGEFQQGAFVKFIAPDLGGLKAVVEDFCRYDRIRFRHMALINKDGSEETESETARLWVGATEEYSFSESEGGTQLSVVLEIHKSCENMFNDGFPNALTLLKELCETNPRKKEVQ